MRSSTVVLAISLVVALAAAIGLTGCAGCAPIGCGRNSDCPTGQVCNVAAQCSLAPDGGGDGQVGDALPIDASTDDAAPDDAAARTVPEPPERSVYPRRHGRHPLRMRP